MQTNGHGSRVTQRDFKMFLKSRQEPTKMAVHY